MFTDDDPIVGVDLHDCRNPETGEIDDWAASIVETLDSYTEISPSGTGVHVLVIGELPGDRNRSGDLEIYEPARFFTVTGDHFVGMPAELKVRPRALEAVTSEFLLAEESAAAGTSHDASSKSTDCLDDVP